VAASGVPTAIHDVQVIRRHSRVEWSGSLSGALRFFWPAATSASLPSPRCLELFYGGL
jgi:hypothetical protein